MADRKVLNKYYPPDFDPSKVPRSKKGRPVQVKVRMMLPMSVCCKRCGNYMYQGTKYNSRKETVQGRDYLGIKIYRFYMKCTRCAAEFTITTDPEHNDYAAEHGCTRNFTPWLEAAKKEKEEQDAKTAEEEGDAMRVLENKTKDSAQLMDSLDALEELRGLAAARANVSVNDALRAHRDRRGQVGADADAGDSSAFEEEAEVARLRELQLQKQEQAGIAQQRSVFCVDGAFANLAKPRAARSSTAAVGVGSDAPPGSASTQPLVTASTDVSQTAGSGGGTGGAGAGAVSTGALAGLAAYASSDDD